MIGWFTIWRIIITISLSKMQELNIEWMSWVNPRSWKVVSGKYKLMCIIFLEIHQCNISIVDYCALYHSYPLASLPSLIWPFISCKLCPDHKDAWFRILDPPLRYENQFYGKRAYTHNRTCWVIKKTMKRETSFFARMPSKIHAMCCLSVSRRIRMCSQWCWKNVRGIYW